MNNLEEFNIALELFNLIKDSQKISLIKTQIKEIENNKKIRIINFINTLFNNLSITTNQNYKHIKKELDKLKTPEFNCEVGYYFKVIKDIEFNDFTDYNEPKVYILNAESILKVVWIAGYGIDLIDITTNKLFRLMNSQIPELLIKIEYEQD